MNRRQFLSGLVALFAAEAAKEVIPFNRVWSFPSKIVIHKRLPFDADMQLYGGAKGGGKLFQQLVQYSVYSTDWKLRCSFKAPPLLSVPEAFDFASKNTVLEMAMPETGNLIVFDESNFLSARTPHYFNSEDFHQSNGEQLSGLKRS